MAIIGTWQLKHISTTYSSDCEARSMATKWQRVSMILPWLTRRKDDKFQSLLSSSGKLNMKRVSVTVMALLYDR